MAATKPSAREQATPLFDNELSDLPQEARWREWMGRVEAAIFAASTPVPRDVLAGLVGRDCVLDDLIADIRDELRPRPYDIAIVAGGYQHRTRPRFADAIRHALGATETAERPNLTALESLTVAAIAYLQPVTRERLTHVLGRDISRDVLALLKRRGLVGAGPRMAQPGAPLTYVTTPGFLAAFGLNTLQDLPELEGEF
jgi:segregation and condensation protein B